MPKELKFDICVIGAGSGGLTVAAGASQMGAKTVLIENGKMGGDCLNYGCVPSKAIIAAAKQAHQAETSGKFGVHNKTQIEFLEVQKHVQDVIKTIEPHDSIERFEGLGVHVIQGTARFSGPDRVMVGDQIILARRFVISTGSSPFVPPIPGLNEVPYLTNETIFYHQPQPKNMIVLGGGPIGVEMAQAFHRLGTDITILEMFGLLGKDDPEVTNVVKNQLINEGVSIKERVKILSIEQSGSQINAQIEKDGKKETIQGTEILVAAGRKANIEDLNLASAGIESSPKGIIVDKRLRTTNKKVYAIGDVIGNLQFTHVASYQAGIVIKNALFCLPSKVSYKAVPWVTYTDPEVAHVGLNEDMAKQAGHKIKVLRFGFDENDRAQAEKSTEGLIKVVVTPKGKVLGASIVGKNAGELIFPWTMAVNQGMNISKVANTIAPYPTFSEINKRVAGSYFLNIIFSDRTKKIVQFLQKVFK